MSGTAIGPRSRHTVFWPTYGHDRRSLNASRYEGAAGGEVIFLPASVLPQPEHHRLQVGELLDALTAPTGVGTGGTSNGWKVSRSRSSR